MVEVTFDSFKWSGATPPRQHAMKFVFNVNTDQTLLLWFYSGILKFKLSESWQYIAASRKKFFGHHFRRERQFTLPFQLNDRTLDHIEDKRDGAGKLDFKVDVELVGIEAGRLSGIDINTVRDLDKIGKFNDTVHGELYRSEWVELLEQWGYREYTVIEIPMISEIFLKLLNTKSATKQPLKEMLNYFYKSPQLFSSILVCD